jgi:hypothetical protein
MLTSVLAMWKAPARYLEPISWKHHHPRRQRSSVLDFIVEETRGCKVFPRATKLSMGTVLLYASYSSEPDCKASLWGQEGQGHRLPGLLTLVAMAYQSRPAPARAVCIFLLWICGFIESFSSKCILFMHICPKEEMHGSLAQESCLPDPRFFILEMNLGWDTCLLPLISISCSAPSRERVGCTPERLRTLNTCEVLYPSAHCSEPEHPMLLTWVRPLDISPCWFSVWTCIWNKREPCSRQVIMFGLQQFHFWPSYQHPMPPGPSLCTMQSQIDFNASP